MVSITPFPFDNILPYSSPTFPQPSSLTVEGKPIGISPASIPTNGHTAQWVTTNASIPERITNVITRYLYLDGPQDQFYTLGRKRLVSTVSKQVEQSKAVEIVFPGFPFKSPAVGTKVLSSLPDYGEELLLTRLEMMARSVEDCYRNGCVIRVVSDGIVYGDILGRSNSLIYQYNHGLRRIVERLGFTHITFVRLADLLNEGLTIDLKPMSEEEYVNSIPDIRAKLLSHQVRGFDLNTSLKEDAGTLATYRGYLKFLVADLEGTALMEGLSRSAQDRERRRIAKVMLTNGAKFSDLTDRKFPDAVRISVHAHSNQGPKFAFNMFPGSDMCASPWHNVIMERADGALECRPLRVYDPQTYEIVMQEDRPYYIRERSDSRDFGEALNPFVKFQRSWPFGLVIRVDTAANIKLSDLPMEKLRHLTDTYSLVLLKGFMRVDEQTLIAKAKEFGQVQIHSKFGEVLKIKDDPSFSAGSSLTQESMPMHYDGVFFTKSDPITGKLTHNPPEYQLFQCIHAPDSTKGGQTLVSNSADLLKYGLTESQREWLRSKSWKVYTPINKAFGGDLLGLPLVTSNERTGNEVLRWHEQWPQHVTQYSKVDSWIDAVPEDISTHVGSFLTELCYDRRFCYNHQWETGDFLIADNIQNLHTRTAFEACPRELWRIHLN